MSHIVVLGAHGQVGRAVVELAQQRGVPHRALSRADCDITDQAALRTNIQPGDFVINCAAYTAVDRAETNIGEAYRLNAVAPEQIAMVCAKIGAPLIQLSTDYVFDGTGSRPAQEEDAPRPLSVYGRSKLAGEIAVRMGTPAHIILRTSWVFSPHGINFVKTIRRIAGERAALRVVDDQVGGPTAACDIAAAVHAIIDAAATPSFACWGTYHFSGAPAVSWLDFARASLADGKAEVTATTTAEYAAPARRPMSSVLDCSRVRAVFGIPQPDWRPALAEVLRQLG
jgi:dTDP-4-dehydrorhamnose reductase